MPTFFDNDELSANADANSSAAMLPSLVKSIIDRSNKSTSTEPVQGPVQGTTSSPSIASDDGTITSPSQVSNEATRLKNPPVPEQTNITNPVPKYGDVAGAQKASDIAETQVGNSAKTAATAQYEADTARQTRLQGVQDDYLKNLTTIDANYKNSIDQAHKTAAAETASWMQDMDARAAAKPDPGHWWHNTSNFGKAMWLMSLGFGAYAESKGGKNVASEMMQKVMQEDITEQREAIKRKYDVGVRKGEIMREEQRDTRAELRDDYTHQVGRINAMLAANTVKANGATSDDLKAKYAAIDTDLHERKAKVAETRLTNTLHERINEVNNSHENARAKARQEFELKKDETDFTHKKELAQMGIDAKLAAAEAKAQKKQDLHEFPIQSGMKIRLKGTDGKISEAPYAVPKDQAKEASEIVRNGQAKVVGLTSLKEAIEKNGLPYGMLSNNNEGRQALAAVVDPIIKQIGGRFTTPTAKTVSDMILGEDPSSFWQRAKGASQEDIVKLLEKEIQEAGGATKQQLLGIPGSNLADNPDADLVFTSPDTRGPKEYEKSNDEKIEAATGSPAKPVVLKSPKDIKEFGADAEKQMPDELHTIIEDAKAKLAGGFDKENTREIAKQAQEKIMDWTSKHPDPNGGATQNNNAMMLVDDAVQRANKVADRLPEIKAKLEVKSAQARNVDREDLEKELDRAGIVVPTEQIKSILEEIRSKNPYVKYRK